MAKTLTAVAVKNHRPGKKRREIPDGGCPGLHLVVQPSGAKSWALRYRRPDKRTAKLVLGSVFERDGNEPDTEPVIGGHLTLAAAHRLVAELRHQIAQGRDPGATYMAERERRRAATLDRAANTFSTAARDFVEQYASKKTRRWEGTSAAPRHSARGSGTHSKGPRRSVEQEANRRNRRPRYLRRG